MLGFDKKYISASDQDADPALLNMIAAVEDAKENNPFVVYEATGNDLIYAIFDIAKNDDGVHLEKALGIIGALAGYSCAMTAGLVTEQSGKLEAHGKLIDTLLFEGNTSLYRVWVSKAAVLGSPATLDLTEMLAHHHAQEGTPGFGVPRLPAGRHLDELPLTFVLDHWAGLISILNRYDEHFAGWPLSWAAAGAQLMEMGLSAMPADEALQIMMECAVPISRLGPNGLDDLKSARAA